MVKKRDHGGHFTPKDALGEPTEPGKPHTQLVVPRPKHEVKWGEPPLVEPPKEAKLPLPQATFIQHAGTIGEVTWTKEDDVIRFKKWDTTGVQDTLKARYWLRSAAKQGIIVGRRNPEHGYWEYGPQWRSKDFQLMVDAAEAASRLGAKG